MKHLSRRVFVGLFCVVIGLLVEPTALSAQTLPDERSVTLEFIDIPIDSALLLLSAKSGVGISFDPDIIPLDKKVSLLANRLLLGLALDNVFVKTDLFYKIVGNQIVVKNKPAPSILQTATISGYLRDIDSGEGLVFATIATPTASFGSSSNEYGYYSMTLPIGSYELEYSYVGYAQQSILIDLQRDTVVVTQLKASNSLNEVVILGEIPKESKKTEDYDQMPIEVLGGMASLGGEPDIIRMAQMRAGVSSQVDGFGGLQVRGGGTDQNLILLDGVPVYNTGHALGLFSIFNSSAIKSANLIKGGFPARFGGRLSSVMDVRTKEGNNQELHGEASVSPLLLRGSIEGPISKGKSSFFLSARRTIVDPWLKPLSRYQFERNDEEGQINFLFYDINAKINFQLGEKNQLFLSLYAGKDRYANEVNGVLNTDSGNIEELDQNDISWGNQIGTIRWTSNFNKKMFGHASLSFTGFNFDNFTFNRTTIERPFGDPSKGYTSRLYTSNIQDVIASYDLDYFLSPKYYLKVGVNYTRHRLTPGSDFTTTTVNNDLVDRLIDENDRITQERVKSSRSFDSFEGNEFRAFVENELRFGRKFSTNIGAHFAYQKVGNTSYTSLQPRISAKYKMNTNFSLRAGYSEMDQFFHLLSSAGLGLPSDVWLPSTDVIPPEKSRQISAGLSVEAIKGMNLQLSGFYKSFYNITGFAQGASLDISGNVDWQSDVPIGKGSSRGVEIELEKRTGKLRGWISYTYSKSDRTFDSFNGGATFRANNDRRHLINIISLFQVNDNLEMSIGWTFGSSLPTTVPASTDPIVVDGRVIFIPVITRINNIELPPYHKLDIGFNLYNKYDWGSQKLSFGAYNAYARRNPFYIDVVFDESGDRYNLEQISILPFIPYVSLGMSF